MRPAGGPALRPLLLLLLLLGCLGAAGGEAAGQAGRFSTRERQVCGWQLVPAEEATELRLSCGAPGAEEGGGGGGLRCTYRGQPERCAAYGAQPRQYWRQILGKLRRRSHPCREAGALTARLCGRTGPPEAQLRLVPPGPGPGPSPSPSPATGRSRAKGRGRAQEGRRKAGKGKAAPGSPPPPAPQPPTELAEAYCAEQWHSLCRFLVGFWNG